MPKTYLIANGDYGALDFQRAEDLLRAVGVAYHRSLIVPRLPPEHHVDLLVEGTLYRGFSGVVEYLDTNLATMAAVRREICGTQG